MNLPISKRSIRSTAQGEECLCPSCYNRGYGDDSWHPMTSEYWATYQGLLILSKCKACRADVSERKGGVVPGRMAA